MPPAGPEGGGLIRWPPRPGRVVHDGDMAAVFEHVVRYPGSSAYTREGESGCLRLVACPREAVAPVFFAGEVREPGHCARLLRAAGTLAGSRFFLPAAMLARILREADPVVTCSRERIRFEAFSACASVYGRADLHPEVLVAKSRQPGTVNVDFSAPTRAALAAVRDGSRLRLDLSSTGVALETSSERRVEKRVKLPLRWLRGFLEVGLVQARMVAAARLSGPEALRFLRSLPSRTGRTVLQLVPTRGGLRVSARAEEGSVPLHAPERLALVRELCPTARTLSVHLDPVTRASAWILDFGGSTWTSVLSPLAYRGFSGEGAGLLALADPDRERVLPELRARLAWQDELDADRLGQDLGATREVVGAALAALGSRGLTGFDRARGSWFHRVLPFDPALVEELHPRLVEARELLAESKVRLRSSEPCPVVEVQGTGALHRAVLDPDGARCTCTWFATWGGSRGACKHVLAASLLVEAGEGGEDP